MSPDELITAFKELAHADPEMRIEYTRIDTTETLRLAGWLSGQTRRTFKALAADVRAILSRIIADTSQDTLRSRCRAALANLQEIAE